MNTWPWMRRLAAVLGATVLVTACGGGGSGGVDTGGTGAPLSFSKGPISGFGSVIVNAVRYDDRFATIVDADGNAVRRDDLKLGMVAEIDGDAIVAGSAGATSTARASRIRIASEIVGPVQGVSGQTLTVLGQQVRVDAAPAFDTALPLRLASLVVGGVVEVYALPDGVTGRYLATRIGLKAAPASYRLRGVVASLDTSASARTFTIGALPVTYAALASEQLSAVLANGRIVSLRLAKAPVSGVWTALRIDDASAAPSERNQARIEGLVTAIASATTFFVDGVQVNASGAEFTDGAVALGLRVEVEGALVGGVLIASKVDIKNESESAEIELDGQIDNDPVGQSFVLRGVTVRYDGSVRFDDGSAASLIKGANVEVRGTLAPDGTAVVATRIKFDKP